MKKKNLPRSDKKHRMFHDPNVSPESLIAQGELYLEAERVMDAAEFFRKADHREGLEQLRKIALDQGDSFLFKMVVGGVPGKGTREEWQLLGSRALELGKYAHAVRGYTAAENEEGRKRAEEGLEKMRADLKPWPDGLGPENLKPAEPEAEDLEPEE